MPGLARATDSERASGGSASRAPGDCTLLSPEPTRLVDACHRAHVAVGIVRGFVEMLVGQGLSRARLLATAGLTEEALTRRDGKLPYADFGRLLDRACELTGDDLLGLRWASMLGPRIFSPIAQLVEHGRTLADSLQLAAHYYELHSNRVGYEVLDQGQAMCLRFVPMRDEPERQQRLVSVMVVGGFYRLMRVYASGQAPGQVSFAHRVEPGVAAQYGALFGGDVRFGRRFSGIEFDRCLLSVSTPQCDDEVREALDRVAERRMDRLKHGVPWSARVHEVLRQRAANGPTDMGSVAGALGISARSLRRNLSAEGCAYERVLRDARCSTAKRLLQRTDLSIQEVAYEMGLANPSAFYRAFKRWTGMTPKAYRDHLARKQSL